MRLSDSAIMIDMKLMTNYRLRLIYIFITVTAIAFSSVVASAQVTAPAKPGIANTAAAQIIPPSKVATINSDVFIDPKIGVTRLVKAFATLDAEFKPRHDEIDVLLTQLDVLNKPSILPANIADQDPKVAAAKKGQIEQLTTNIKKKQQEGQALLDKRTKDLTNPIYADLMTSLDAFAKKRGIDLVLDVSKSNGVYIFNRGVDITTAFIAEYNAKPATP